MFERHRIRVPLTADRRLWEAATEVGRDVIWLHTFGARGRTGGRPRLPLERRPQRILYRVNDGSDLWFDRVISRRQDRVLCWSACSI
ncbi:type ISP restriction/modification enzyme [Nonomuraea sp. 3N208]|uniref:type ISP restriction/modification enzyme n=1 Tax=Nonomuraea sp. 3N208 TaxID=3457421 RepID=UPI003FD31B45